MKLLWPSSFGSILSRPQIRTRPCEFMSKVYLKFFKPTKYKSYIINYKSMSKKSKRISLKEVIANAPHSFSRIKPIYFTNKISLPQNLNRSIADFLLINLFSLIKIAFSNYYVTKDNSIPIFTLDLTRSNFFIIKTYQPELWFLPTIVEWRGHWPGQ